MTSFPTRMRNKGFHTHSIFYFIYLFVLYISISSDWNEKLWSNLFSTLINTTDDCRSLLQELEEELLKQTTISKLEEAIMNKNDLLMNDD